MRHYHRAGSPDNRTWDEWIDGSSAGSRAPRRQGLKIAGIIVAVLTLVAIIVGLIIELG